MNLLVDTTVKVSLIVLMALVARALLRRQSAAVRHWVLSVAVGCAATLPLLTAMVPVWDVGLGSLQPRAEQSQSSVTTTTTFATGDGRPQSDP